MEALTLSASRIAPSASRGVAVGLPGSVGRLSHGGGDGERTPSFRDVLMQALESVDRAQKEADHLARLTAAGQPVELHQVMMAAEKATLALEVALAVQRKCLEAYQELSRMQI